MDDTMNPSMDPMEEGATEEMPAEEVMTEEAPAEMPAETEEEAI